MFRACNFAVVVAAFTAVSPAISAECDDSLVVGWDLTHERSSFAHHGEGWKSHTICVGAGGAGPKNSFNLSDEELVQRWSENVYLQRFCGQEYFEPRLPCDATQIGRLRRAIGEVGRDCC